MIVEAFSSKFESRQTTNQKMSKLQEFKQVYNMGSGYRGWVDKKLAVKIPEPKVESEAKKEEL